MCRGESERTAITKSGSRPCRNQSSFRNPTSSLSSSTSAFATMQPPPRIPEGISARADPQRSSFLQLPGELRNKIYAATFGAQRTRYIQPLPERSYRSNIPASNSSSKSQIDQRMFSSNLAVDAANMVNRTPEVNDLDFLFRDDLEAQDSLIKVSISYAHLTGVVVVLSRGVP